MKTRFAHMQINVGPENLPFYRDLMSFLGWAIIFDGDGMVGVGGPNQESLWFVGAATEHANDYDGPGMNHLAIGTETVADVDATAAWLAERAVARLFETPRHRAEFAHRETDTYYQVMFESPDRVLFEVVYSGPR